MSTGKIGQSENIYGCALRSARKALGLTQAEFAEPLSISGSYVSDIEKGKAVPSEAVTREISERYRINRIFLETCSGEIFGSLPERLSLPTKNGDRSGEDVGGYSSAQFKTVGVFALAGAGPGRDLVEHDPIETIPVPNSFWKSSTVVIRVRGRSMEPLIRDGAYLGVDRDDRWVVSGEIYAVWIPYEGAVIKRLYVDPEKITLKSENLGFPEFFIPVNEVSDGLILGRVKWVMQGI